jgi:hypothetical protein
MTVVMGSGRIEAVAKFGLIAETHDARVINVAGKYLITGLWDMDVHTASASPAWNERIVYPLYVANGVTGVRDMGGDPDLLDERRQQVEDGASPSPHIFSAPFLSDGSSDAQSVALNDRAEAREALARLKERGVNLLTMRPDISRDSYFALADEAAKPKIQLDGPVPDLITASEASAAGQRSIERLSGILLACSSKEDALRQQRSHGRPVTTGTGIYGSGPGECLFLGSEVRVKVDLRSFHLLMTEPEGYDHREPPFRFRRSFLLSARRDSFQVQKEFPLSASVGTMPISKL